MKRRVPECDTMRQAVYLLLALAWSASAGSERQLYDVVALQQGNSATASAGGSWRQDTSTIYANFASAVAPTKPSRSNSNPNRRSAYSASSTFCRGTSVGSVPDTSTHDQADWDQTHLSCGG